MKHASRHPRRRRIRRGGTLPAAAPVLVAAAVVACGGPDDPGPPPREDAAPTASRPARSAPDEKLPAAPEVSPYAGEEEREIAALSAEDIAGYLTGEGMGFARTAELNGYPGPRHVLDMAGHLQLEPEQRRRVQEAYDRMHTRAVALGERIVDAERELERRFEAGDVAPEEVARLTGAIAALGGALRAVHLAAHLETRDALTREQVRRYEELRGYAGDAAEHDEHGGHGATGGRDETGDRARTAVRTGTH